MFTVRGICLNNDAKEITLDVLVLEDKAKFRHIRRVKFKAVHKIKHFVHAVSKAIPCNENNIIIAPHLNLTSVGLT